MSLFVQESAILQKFSFFSEKVATFWFVRRLYRCEEKKLVVNKTAIGEK